MDNHNGKVVTLTLLLFLSLSMLSLFSGTLVGFWPQAVNIDIFSDIDGLPHEAASDAGKERMQGTQTAIADSSGIKAPDSSVFQYSHYQQAGRFIVGDDYRPGVALPGVKRKLAALKRNEKVKLRIAWFGDSLIEGDLITQTVRELLQNEYGRLHGAGFVPFRSITAGFRTSATAISSGSWREENFRNAKAETPLFFCGHVFYSGDGRFVLKDNTVKDSLQVLQKWLLCGHSGAPFTVLVNGQPLSMRAPERFNRILLDKSRASRVNLQFSSAGHVPLYGVSSEPEYGVVVDNFSFRGISGFELGKFDDALLDDVARSGDYDLIVIQYGVNLMFRPKDTNYDYYYKGMLPVVRRLKERLPKSEFLLVSCSDRAFRYGTEWKTAIGLDSLVQVQARIAWDNRIPFYNLFLSMGGHGTMVKWAEGNPRLAAKDYVHASPCGAAVLGRYLFDAFMKECQEPQTANISVPK